MNASEPPSPAAVFHSLFATPLMSVPCFIDPCVVDQLIELQTSLPQQSNSHQTALEHSNLLDLSDLARLLPLLTGLKEHITLFGEQLFGERLNWRVKEAWFNRLEYGGRQHDHIHANSFVSGVLYLTDSDPSANPVFHRPSGGMEYVFSNFHPGSQVTPFNAARWQMQNISAGDLILFPSYLRHGVPANKGNSRLSLAFNAIPDRLNSWGYEVRFEQP